jgi:hypothetical protein
VGEEEMVEATLTDEMIMAGAELIRRLDQSGLEPDAAFWQYFSDLQEWKLVIVEVKLEHLGPREIYKGIQRVMSQASDELGGLPLDSVTLAKPDSLVVSLLRHAVRTGEGISGIRFTNNVINGTLVEDAYIYRLT